MKRKIFSLVLALCLVASLLPAVRTAASASVSVWDGTVPNIVNTSAGYSGGDGTTADTPYLISSGEDLALFSVNVTNITNYSSGKYFKLTTDIVLNDETFTFDPASGIVTVTDGTYTGYLGTGIKGTAYNNTSASTAGAWYTSAALTGTLTVDADGYGGTLNSWVPIGSSGHFAGIFDGNGHTVSGVYTNGSDEYRSLFACVEGGTVKNMGVINSYIKGTNHIAGVAGLIYSGGTVSSCYNTGIVCGTSDYVGGIAGQNNSTVSNCYNMGSVGGNSYVGGIAGLNSGTVSNCYNAASVGGNSFVGGVAGQNSGTVSGCCYDKQMCVVGGINGGDTVDAAGKLTSEMTGAGIQSTLGNTYWTYADGLYPRLTGMESSDTALVFASPVTLAHTSDTDFETVYEVKSTIGLGTPSNSNSEYVTWSSSDPDIVSVSGSVGSVGADSSGFVTLTASLNGVSKSVTLSVRPLPNVLPTNGSFTDTDSSNDGEIAGAISWTAASPATGIIGYHIYWGSDRTTKLSGHDTLLYEITGASTASQAVSSTAPPSGANYFLIYSYNSIGDSADCLAVRIINLPFNFSGGSGTDSDPYLISNAYDFEALSILVSKGNNYSSTYFKQTGDIALNDETLTFDPSSGILSVTDGTNTGYLGTGVKGTAYNKTTASTAGAWYTSYALTGTLTPDSYGGKLDCWTPIGISSSYYFQGTFDGNGHTVSGVYINSTGDYQGLFGYVDGGTVKNLGVVNSYMKGKNYVGGIAGCIHGSAVISRCRYSGAVSGSGHAGGITGDNYDGTVSYCCNAGRVFSSGNYAGGIAACSGGNYADGKMVWSGRGTVSYCCNTGRVDGNSYVGGITGYNCDGGTVSYCSNAGSVNNASLHTGGVVGYNGGVVSCCFSIGSVTSSLYYIGGVAGSNGNGTISNCYNTGSIYTDVDCAGGVVGNNSGTISNCYNTGSVKCCAYIGAVSGYNAGSVTHCYFDKQMCTETDMYATGKLTSEMTGDGIQSALGDTYWSYDDGLYPRLKNMDSTDAALVSASPVSFAYTSDSDYETPAEVKTIVSLGTPANSSGKHVTWASSDSSIVSVSGGSARIVSGGPVTLTASLNGISETVTLTALKAPALTAGAVNRTSDTAATVKFTSDEAGTCYYSVVADNAAAPEINTGETGMECTAGETTLILSLTAGAKDIYVKMKDAAGKVSSALKIDIAAYTVPSSPGYTVIADNGASIVVNGESHAAGFSETTTGSDGRTTTAVTVDAEKLESILGSEGTGATVTVPVTGNSDILAGVLTGQTVKDMESESATLVVQTDSASYNLPASEIDIDGIAGQFGTDVSLSDIKVIISVAEPSADMAAAVENASAGGGFMVLVPAVDFTISCEYNGQTVGVNGFSGYVEREIAIPDGVDAGEITTAVIVDSDGTSRQVPTKIIKENGKYFAVINSLTNSTYAVVYHPVEFADVSAHWAKDDINDMGSRMIVYGDENGAYNPDNKITRAEFAAIIVRALGLAQGTGESGFSDVASTDWYSGYIKTASEYGIVTGYPDGAFGPNDTITHEQAITIISRAMKLTGLEADASAEIPAQFGDASDISSYAFDGVKDCISAGIVAGRDGSAIAPQALITRAEAAVVVLRLLRKSGLI